MLAGISLKKRIIFVELTTGIPGTATIIIFFRKFEIPELIAFGNKKPPPVIRPAEAQ